MNAHDELAAAGRRQADIDRRIADASRKLKERETARKGKPGRMKAAEQQKENDLHALLVRLKNGFLPGEMMTTARAPVAQVVASAQQNLQHHAADGVAPRGRPSPAGSGGGSGGGDIDGGGDENGGDDGDDGEKNHNFSNYYRVTPQQRAFNLEAKDHFKKAGSSRISAVYRPKDVLKAGCDRQLIGVGPCHVHAPHLFLGLPKPPCLHSYSVPPPGSPICLGLWRQCRPQCATQRCSLRLTRLSRRQTMRSLALQLTLELQQMQAPPVVHRHPPQEGTGVIHAGRSAKALRLSHNISGCTSRAQTEESAVSLLGRKSGSVCAKRQLRRWRVCMQAEVQSDCAPCQVARAYCMFTSVHSIQTVSCPFRVMVIRQ